MAHCAALPFSRFVTKMTLYSLVDRVYTQTCWQRKKKVKITSIFGFGFFSLFQRCTTPILFMTAPRHHDRKRRGDRQRERERRDQVSVCSQNVCKCRANRALDWNTHFNNIPRHTAQRDIHLKTFINKKKKIIIK